jgi:hypothetical protein
MACTDGKTGRKTMSYVIHDRKGYLCDLASAYACSGVMNWLAGIEHSPLVTEFLVKGRARVERFLEPDSGQLQGGHCR